ncbi:MAG: hypothetical protein ACFE9N_14195 [Promethearchaeota archaeon]
MEINLEILNMVLLIILILILCLTLAYIFLPQLFNLLWSPRFNATYLYKSKDFKKKKKLKPNPIQNKVGQVHFDKTQNTYSISFGAKRELTNGILKIRHGTHVYTNKNSPESKSKVFNLTSISENEGFDKLGIFKAINGDFQLENQDKTISISIKQYENQDFIIFELSIPEGLDNTSSGEFSEMVTSFPSFMNKSPNTTIFTYRNTKFCPPSRKINATSAPVVFYDEDLNCFIISPLDSFLNTIISKDKHNRINCGIQGRIKQIPKNFTQKFILLFGRGINKSMERLGDILLKYHNSKRKSLYANIVTSYIGFWTNNGGYYYYKTEKGMNYEDTMIAIKEYFDKKNIPIRYYNFDSWWYLKHTNKTLTTIFRPLVRIMGGGLYGNTLRWEVDPKNFTTSLKIFHRERFKIPITAHSRRWDSRSPYTEKYEFVTYKNHAVPLKKEFWLWLMNHAKESGIIVYEQDWMKNLIKNIPFLSENYYSQEIWLDNMASAAKENGVDVFYCMQTPGILLYSLKHTNIVISRCSEDYNHRWPLTYRFIHSTQANILFKVVGINSHPDVFRSRTMEKVRCRLFGEKYPDFNCLYQILNAGVVAPGDKKEYVNWPLLKKTCRSDGLLLKPDKPLTANDIMFKKHKKYYICDTLTYINNFTWRYILISNIWPKRVKETFFTLKELGYEKNDYIIYDFLNKDVSRVNIDDFIEVGKLKRYSIKYYILCPITINGMALIGCPDKFVTCSGKLILNVNATKDSLNFTVENAINDETKLLIYSEDKPTSIQIDGTFMNSWIYNESINIIELNLVFDKFSKKKISIHK